MSKNFVKKSVAAALLTTSVLSFAPAALGATSVDQTVNKVKTELNKATTHYVYPSLERKLVPSSTLYPALNSAKKNYQNARKSIQGASGLSTAQKNAKLGEIDSLYNEKISGGLVPYIDAHNYATKYLVPIMNELNEAQARNDFAAVEKAYHKLSYQLKGRTAILYRFSGKAARDLLLEQYKKPADAKRDELMVPVTIYMELVKINDFLATNKLTEAKASLAEVEALLPRLTTNKFTAALIVEVDKARKAVNGTITPAPTPPITNPGNPPADGGTTTPAQQQQILDTKVAAIIATLNATQSDIATVEKTGANAYTVTIKEDVKPEAINSYLGKGLFAQLVTQVGVTHVNGLNPLSPEGVNYLKNQIPTDIKSADELKGKSYSLPVTVNNGSAIDVTFSVTFK
ncbi:hypothetical protein [Psychrobacillus sp. MER TA 171]|uniref:hypothetical protein n=1 Tax=Psychrobacillus sp. MER TA 171 TaxID=2939577 RepID=UPI00203E7D3E|nr:hypothetical protein [Psychrobacillus sp. MER TA 171]MCM3356547.1 hypothetical protein [Psychrobacillus sp. MER TA 171]